MKNYEPRLDSVSASHGNQTGHDKLALGLRLGSRLDLVLKWCIVFAGNANDVMLTDDHADNSSFISRSHRVAGDLRPPAKFILFYFNDLQPPCNYCYYLLLINTAIIIGLIMSTGGIIRRKKPQSIKHSQIQKTFKTQET